MAVDQQQELIEPVAEQAAETAETALLALAEPLVWEAAEAYDFQDWGYHCFAIAGDAGDKEYAVRFRAHSDALSATLFIKDVEQPQCPFTGTLQQMKAACERHHATGKWE